MKFRKLNERMKNFLKLIVSFKASSGIFCSVRLKKVCLALLLFTMGFLVLLFLFIEQYLFNFRARKLPEWSSFC